MSITYIPANELTWHRSKEQNEEVPNGKVAIIIRIYTSEIRFGKETKRVAAGESEKGR